MADVAAPDALTGAWEGRVGARLAGLAGARIVAQVLGVVWFIVAARALSADDFGILSGALALMVVLGGFSDLGTTRTVVRHVAEDPRRLWSTYSRALGLRVASGIVVGAVAIVVLRAASIDLPTSAVALAAWIALASGANEVGYAALRSVGRVRAEMALLVLERTLFTLVACAAVALGAGPLLALAVYAATNSVTAVLATVRLRRLSRGLTPRAPGPLLDAEGRRTAIASGLVIVAPRVSAVVLLVLASRGAVGSLAVAQKPTDAALTLLAVAMLAPMLPMLRSRVMTGRRVDAVETAARFTSLVLLLCGPVLAWLVVDASGVLRLLYGEESRPGASSALVVLAVASVIAIYRNLGELLCLAEEQVGRYVLAIASGTLAALVASVALVGAHGAAGAAWASLIGEAVVLALVLRALPALRSGALLATVAKPAALTALTAAGVFAVRDAGERAAGVVVALGSVAALVLARQGLRSIDRSAGAAGDHADVGAQPRRDDVR